MVEHLTFSEREKLRETSKVFYRILNKICYYIPPYFYENFSQLDNNTPKQLLLCGHWDSVRKQYIGTIFILPLFKPKGNNGLEGSVIVDKNGAFFPVGKWVSDTDNFFTEYMFDSNGRKQGDQKTFLKTPKGMKLLRIKTFVNNVLTKEIVYEPENVINMTNYNDDNSMVLATTFPNGRQVIRTTDTEGNEINITGYFGEEHIYTANLIDPTTYEIVNNINEWIGNFASVNGTNIFRDDDYEYVVDNPDIFWYNILFNEP